VLLLDEATSSLDSESEAAIQDGLRYLMQGRTTFIAAHRLSTIVHTDQILVLDGGVVVERGTHETLYARRGRYYQLATRQYESIADPDSVCASAQHRETWAATYGCSDSTCPTTPARSS
jgi:ABC-type transport system involved in cytochrome bd biosynthesis fused ATPase/permease subunit